MSLVISRLSLVNELIYPRIKHEIQKVVSVALKAIKDLAEVIYVTLENWVSSFKWKLIDLTSILWPWKYQAIYLRVKMLVWSLSSYLEKGKALNKEKAFLRKNQAQAVQIAKLNHELSELSQELKVYRIEVLQGYELQIDTAVKNESLSRELEKEKNEIFRLKLKSEIQESESEFRDLFQKILIFHEKIEVSEGSYLPTEIGYVIDTLIPKWKAHVESLVKILEELLTTTCDSSTGKQVMIKIIEFAKRPLILTDMVIRMNALVQLRSKLLAIKPIDDVIEVKEINPKIFEQAEALKALLRSPLKVKNKKRI